MIVTPIKKDCKKCRAGVRCLWAIDCSCVTDIIFDEDRNIIGICCIGQGLVKLEFCPNTALLSQEKTKVKNCTIVNQALSFKIQCLSTENRNALEDLNGCCCIHVIVQDNGGNYHYLGISLEEDGTYTDEEMSTADGSANTGADPTTDLSEYTETLTATTTMYAPQVKKENIVDILTACICDKEGIVNSQDGGYLVDSEGCIIQLT